MGLFDFLLLIFVFWVWMGWIFGFLWIGILDSNEVWVGFGLVGWVGVVGNGFFGCFCYGFVGFLVGFFLVFFFFLGFGSSGFGEQRAVVGSGLFGCFCYGFVGSLVGI